MTKYRSSAVSSVSSRAVRAASAADSVVDSAADVPSNSHPAQ